MTRYFLDTEFIENGVTIDLISIGLVSEDGREYYAVNKQCNFKRANDWVLENVLLPLGIDKRGIRNPIPALNGFHGLDRLYVEMTAPFVKSKTQIKKEILDFVQYNSLNEQSPLEFWGYFADYDWVVFCQLFGCMTDLPKGFPMYCRDIKQLCDDLGNPKLPEQEGEHHALSDARWNLEVWKRLNELRTV